MNSQKLGGVFFGLGLAALSGALLSYAVWRGTPSPVALTPDANMDLLSIPEFSMTSQDKETVTRDALLGELTIIDFIFTHCPFICPTMGQNMILAQRELAGTGVRFMSFSVDPENDTPERLRTYAESIGADISTWTFLTGDIENVQRILRDGLLLGELFEDPSRQVTLPDGSTMNNIGHPGRFILIGPEGEIISLCDGTNEESVRILIERARAAAEELAR